MEKSRIYTELSELLIRKFESKNTINVYDSYGKSFIYDKHPDSIEKLTDKYLLSYITSIKKNYSVSKYNQIVSVLKIIYHDLFGQRFKLKNVKCVKVYPKLKNLPDIKEVFVKINAVNNIKHKTILMTLLMTGLRISELLNLKISDIDSVSMKILVRNAKGGDTNFAILTNQLLFQLREYYNECNPKNFLFEGVNEKYSKTSVNNVVKKYIGKKYSAHWLRHLSITHVISKNIPLPKAKLFSRHKSDSAIAFYYHYDKNTFKEIRSVISEIAS